MKAKELKDLRTKEKKDLVKMVNEKRVELTKITSRMYAGREKNLKKGKMIRRDIAQIMSIMNMKGEIISK